MANDELWNAYRSIRDAAASLDFAGKQRYAERARDLAKDIYEMIEDE